MHLIEEYPEYPRGDGTCFICHCARRAESFRPEGERLIDLDVMTDRIEDLEGGLHGFTTPVICETCIRQMIDMIGGLDPEAADRMRAEKGDLAQQRDLIRAELQGVRGRLMDVAL